MGTDFVKFASTFRVVCKTPEMFAISGAIREVLAFLSGLYIGLYRLSSEVTETADDPLDGFNKWLARQDGIEANRDWSRTAYEVLKIYNEDEALEKLLALFDRYIKEQMGMTPESYQINLFDEDSGTMVN